MKTLVIAAGMGSSFRGKSPRSHKTLIPVLGLAVIERILAACPATEELVVVTGFRAEVLEDKLRRLLNGKVRLTFVRSANWEQGNGVSVLAAREALAGEEAFLLSMSDHLYEPALVERLTADGPPPPGQCLLAVDRDLESCYDLQDATRVLIGEQGKILRIGKRLEQFDAIDTGVFYCTPALFPALEEAQGHGGYSLSDGVRLLCERGSMGYREVTGCLWQDVDEPGSLREARRRLWARVAKPRDGIVSRLLNRKVSGAITRAVCHLPIHPNHVTVFNLLLAAAAAGLMAAGHLPAGALLAQLYSIVDGVDGELSRLKHQGSWFGGWLDNLTDRLCDWLILGGAAWSVTATGGSSTLAWLLLAAALTSNILYRTVMDALLVSGVLRRGAVARGRLARVEQWFLDREMVFGLTHDSQLLLLALGVALGRPLETLVLLIVLENLWWGAKLAQARRAAPSERYAELLNDEKRAVARAVHLAAD